MKQTKKTRAASELPQVGLPMAGSVEDAVVVTAEWYGMDGASACVLLGDVRAGRRETVAQRFAMDLLARVRCWWCGAVLDNGARYCDDWCASGGARAAMRRLSWNAAVNGGQPRRGPRQAAGGMR